MRNVSGDIRLQTGGKYADNNDGISINDADRTPEPIHTIETGNARPTDLTPFDGHGL
ncbi:MAG: hypothetical protein ABIS51_20320 [Sphingomonas sp.]